MDKNKKENLKKKSIILAVVLFLVSAIVIGTVVVVNSIDSKENIEEQVQKHVEEAETPTDKEEDKDDAKNEAESAEEESDSISQENEPADLYEDMRVLLEDNLKIVDIEYDEQRNAYLMHSTDPAFLDEVDSILNGSLPSDSWHYMAETFADLSLTVSDTLTDDSIKLALVNPANEEKMLLVVSNGVIEYNFMDDYEGI